MKLNTYESESKKIAEGGGSVLLQACCAPCASVCFEVFAAAGFGAGVLPRVCAAENKLSTDGAQGLCAAENKIGVGFGKRVAAYYYNPNIMPFSEYQQRRESLEKLCGIMGAELFVGDYDNDLFLRHVKGFERDKEGGKRCELCYRIRLFATAVAAKREGFDYFATSLTLSPHKNSDLINAVGFEVANQVGVLYLASDFKKRGGYQRSVELSKEYGLYRQNYCGCRLGEE